MTQQKEVTKEKDNLFVNLLLPSKSAEAQLSYVPFPSDNRLLGACLTLGLGGSDGIV